MSNQWQYIAPNGLAQPGGATVGGGGSPGGTTLTGYRSIVDAARSAALPFTPDSEYPDGYLGNINSRRGDRLLDNVKNRLTSKSYQRGVHKGERVDPRDYYWNDQVNPQAGIQAEAQGKRWTQIGSTPVEQINHMGKNHLMKPEEYDAFVRQMGLSTPGQIDPIRSARMGSLLPSWK